MIPIFAIALCTLLISVNGVLFIWYNSTRTLSAWAAAVVLPWALERLVTFRLDNVPFTISLPIFKYILDDSLLASNPVTEEPPVTDGSNTKDVAVLVIAPFKVVLKPDVAFLISTLFAVEYIAWSAWITFITVELLVRSNGFGLSLLP